MCTAMFMEEGKKVEPVGFGFPAQARPGRTRVGWIGIGVMGGAMATRLLAAGFAVTAYARTPAKAEALVAAGANVADSPSSVAAASDVVFTMVSDPADVRAVVLERATGALAGLCPGGVLVDCTSSSPSLAREIALAARAAGCHAVNRDFASGPGSVRYIIKDLGMALEVGDGQEEATALPGAALFRQMFSAMAANGDGDLCVRGMITVVERLNGIRK